MSLPEVLFDGHRVYRSLPPEVTRRVSPATVSDVLDCVVRLAREDAKNAPAFDAFAVHAAVVRYLKAERALQVAMLDPAWRAKYPSAAGIESPEVQEKTAARVALRLLSEQYNQETPANAAYL